MEMVHEHRMSVMNALTLEWDALAYVPSLMIVSCEHIHSRLRTANDLAHAKALLAPFCASFRVVVYLRPQWELAQSTAITALRQGAAEFKPIPDFETPNGFDSVLGVDFEHFDYFNLLQRLEDVFGPDAIDARLYEEDELRSNDIVEDFFDRMDCPIAGLPRPRRENTSLRPEAVLFLLELDKHLTGHPSADAIRERVLSFLSLAYSGAAQAASLDDIRRFMTGFTASNEAVRRRWFPERKALFSEPRLEGPPALNDGPMFKIFVELFCRAIGAN